MIVCESALALIFGILPSVANADVSTPFEDVKESISKMTGTLDGAIDGLIEQSTLAGKISPILNKLFLTSEQRQNIWYGITSVASLSDIILLLILGFAVVPTVEVPYTRFIMSRDTKHADRDFHSTTMFHVLISLAQMARLAFVVYAFDMVKIMLVGAGFSIPRHERVTHAFAYVCGSAVFRSARARLGAPTITNTLSFSQLGFIYHLGSNKIEQIQAICSGAG